MIIKCKCNHNYQDREHGKDMRVHNKCKETGKYRCTVCSDVKSHSVAK